MKINFNRSMKFYEKYLAEKGYNSRANKKYIELVSQYIRKFAESNPDLTAKEIREKFFENMYDKINDYVENASYRGPVIQLMICEGVMNDSNFIDAAYEKVKEDNITEEDKFMDYDSKNLENLKYNYVKGLLFGIRNREEESAREAANLEIYDMHKNKKNFNMPKHHREIMEISRKLNTGSEVSRIKAFAKRHRTIIEKNLKEKYVELMVRIGTFLDDFNLLDKYQKINNIELKQMGLEALEYKLDIEDSNSDEMGIKDIFKEETLNNMSLEELTMLNIFWQNRFAKELNSLNDAIFYVDTLNLWDDIIKGKELNLDDTKAMDAVFLKGRLMEFIGMQIFTDEKTLENKLEEYENGVRVYDTTDSFLDLDKQIGKKYKQYFDEMLPNSDNIFIDDLNASFILYSNKENVYYCKDSSLISLLNTFMTSKKIKNWGYMQQQEGNKDNKYVLIGIDYEGFNMPLRVHMKKEELIENLKVITGNTIIPMYEGEQDFLYKKNIIRSQLLMPLDKKHKVDIRNISKEIKEKDPRYKFIKHLDFLRDSNNFPEHLKVEEPNGKKGIKVRKRRYIDVVTQEQYFMNKKKYVLVGDEESGRNGIGFEDDSR